jgi:glycosyltransferase involved in cell wall biosynthesis
MKIWIVNYNTPLPSWPGSSRHYNLARGLINHGHNVTIITANFSHFKRAYIVSKGTKNTVINGVEYYWIPVTSYKKNISRLYSMLVFAWRVLFKKYLPCIERPDIIIGSSPSPFVAFSAYRLARRFKVPYVLEVRDLWPETLITLGGISRFNPIILLMKWV